MQRLQRATSGGQTMVIEATREPDDEYTLKVSIDGYSRTYSNIIRNWTTDANKLYLQSRWGSGVKFTSAKVKKLP